MIPRMAFESHPGLEASKSSKKAGRGRGCGWSGPIVNGHNEYLYRLTCEEHEEHRPRFRSFDRD
jgi:hypothetical protein